MQADTCLVLMFKAPQRSKRRLAAQIGPRAEAAAEHLLACALDDLRGWSGPTCLAPADSEDMPFARRHGASAAAVVAQGTGNLGTRIEHVNAGLLAAGHRRQLFIGIDCPALEPDYLDRAAVSLTGADAVLGPADDGGVVLMGVRGRWPTLTCLPWSEPGLRPALQQTCMAHGMQIALLDAHADVDNLADLQSLPARLAADPRPSRRRLCEWIRREVAA